jgi:IS5 family transposase
LKYRYRLGFERFCAEVTDSISWQRFCRVPLGGSVPHPTTLMKITKRCGEAAVNGLNEALLAKAAEAKVLRTNRLRADTTVVEANVAYPTDSGLLAKGVAKGGGGGEQAAPDGAWRPARKWWTRPARPGPRPATSGPTCAAAPTTSWPT